MAGEVYHLKQNDTLPPFATKLRKRDPDNPNKWIPYDLTTAQSVTLIIHLPDGTLFKRPCIVVGVPTEGDIRYDFASTDWALGTPPMLVISNTPPFAPDALPGHETEVEVIEPGGGRATFPNDGYDYYVMWPHLGDT